MARKQTQDLSKDAVLKFILVVILYSKTDQSHMEKKSRNVAFQLQDFFSPDAFPLMSLKKRKASFSY